MDFVSRIFGDIGTKLKKVAVISYFELEILIVIFVFVNAEENLLGTIVNGVIASILTHSLCLFLYGFGEIVNKTVKGTECDIKNTHRKQVTSVKDKHHEEKRSENVARARRITVRDIENSKIEYIESMAYICGNCGFSEPYFGSCPQCSSDEKTYLPNDNMHNAVCEICGKKDDLYFAKMYKDENMDLIKICENCLDKYSVN